MKRAVLYLRVSTTEQTTANQERELREVARAHGLRDYPRLQRHGLLGAKGRDKRPAFDRSAVTPLSASSMWYGLVASTAFAAASNTWLDSSPSCTRCKVDLFLHQQGLDTTTPAGKALFQMMGVFAEFERSMIQERVRAGLKRAKSGRENASAGLR